MNNWLGFSLTPPHLGGIHDGENGFGREEQTSHQTHQHNRTSAPATNTGGADEEAGEQQQEEPEGPPSFSTPISVIPCRSDGSFHVMDSFPPSAPPHQCIFAWPQTRSFFRQK